ncbi:hypothetical protein CYMTET_24196 [Cymbomonas tetramitiformis]|uniref:Uncharacterized protein n=1 Tax=Cymbomonas tetramitiformis TaxID=36881 RepID=A0AAE0L068_9CHLO|nr:hypothetical protein CYMTET_24196 [Cymbomonas tetramitiformis]
MWRWLRLVSVWAGGAPATNLADEDGDEVSHDLDAERVEWLPSRGVEGQQRRDGREGERVENASGGTAGEWSPEERMPLPAQPHVEGPVSKELESPPVPYGLAGLLGMPGGLRTPSVVDDGSEDPGVAAACGLDGVGSAQEEADGGGSGEQGEAGLVSGVGSPLVSECLAGILSTPRPSPGMEGQEFVGPLFRPVEDEWELRRVLRDAKVTWETVAGFGVEEGRGPFHFARQRQEELVGLDQIVGQGIQQYAANMFDDDGSCAPVDLSNSRRRACSHRILLSVRVGARFLLPRWGEESGAVQDACDGAASEGDGGPVTEAHAEGAVQARGVQLPARGAEPPPEAYEAPIMEEGSYEARACDVSAGEAVPWSRAPLDPVPVVEALVEGEIQRAGGVGAAEAATVLPAEVVQATYERSAEDEGGRRGYVRGVPQLVGGCTICMSALQPERQHEVQEEGQQAQEGRQERPWQRRQVLQEWRQPRPQQTERRDARAVVVPRVRRVRRDAAAHDGDLAPGEDDPAFRCPVCAERTAPHSTRMARNLPQAHQPDDYIGMDLTAFGCAACPSCNVAYVSGAELTTHHRGCQERSCGVADAEVTASEAQRWEHLVDPVIPEASWEWLRSLQLSEISACPFSSARHVPKRARDEFAGAVRWVLRNLSGDNEDFWRLLGVAPRMLLAPQPGGRKKSIPAELGRRYGGLHDPGVLAPLEPETLEALEALHPSGDGLPAPVRAAPLVLEEAAVETECRQMPVASGPGCSQLRFEHLSAIFGAGDGVPAIQHACEQIVSNKVPAEILPWLMGARLIALLKPGGGVRPIASGEVLRRLAGEVVCRQMWMRFAAHFEAPPSWIWGDLVGGPGVREDFRDVVHAADDSIPGADVALEGIKVLGIPVGSDPWVVAQCHEIAVKAGEILPKLARLNDPQTQLLLLRRLQAARTRLAGSPYPLGEAAVALSQLPNRGAPLVAGLFSAMEDVRGARLRVLAAEAAGYHATAGAGGVKSGDRAVPLHTAETEHRRKVALYGDVSPHRLVPFAVETFGGLGVQAKKLLEECARGRQDQLGPELVSATWSTPTFMSYWGQKIMVALQGAQAFGPHSRALEDYPQ